MNQVTVEQIKNHLMDTYKLGAEQVETMLVSFTKSLNLEFVKAEKALAANDISALCKAAHSIKGALSSAGVKEWSEIARKIELSAKAEEDRDYKELFNELKSGVKAIL